MGVLQIACLGDFQIEVDGHPPTTSMTDKARALLAYLVMEGQVHERSKLTQFLWPGYSAESARNSLRQSLHLMRQLLHDATAEPSWFLLTRQTVQINPAATIDLDVTTFTQLLAEVATHAHADLATCSLCFDKVRQAVALYRGDFLAGLPVIDSDPFEEWRRIIQEQLHIQQLDALHRLAEAAERAGAFDEALQAAQQQLALEPWQEAAHRQIMRLLALRGQRAAALAQYQRCRQVLAEELGVEPDDETTALYTQIRNSQPQALRAAATVSAPPPSEPPGVPIKVAAWSAHLPPLLGREEELGQIITLLNQSPCRLVTLVGPPGVGKTRLAQAVLMASHFADGGYFIELAALRDPTLLAATIAQALTAAHPTLQFTGDGLIAHLRDQALLLVLDNFEQLLSGVTLVDDLLAHCPRLKILSTSRTPLQLGGEQVIAVHPLPLPVLTAPKGHPAQGALDLAAVAHNEAVQLFCQRAAAVVPGFVLTERLAPVVAEICRRLDGLPLAIELAAAHSRLLPPSALLARLTQRLEVLTSRSHARPERQQTLRAAIAWSYELLDAAEQRLFRQLTVFVGGATLSAIEAVIGDDPDTLSAAPPLLAGLEALLDKNLLRQAELLPAQDEREPRLLMLETLREYGWELLTAAEASAPVTQKRHAEYFLRLAETAAPKLHGPDQVAWLNRLALEHDNLRAALVWLIQTGEVHKALRLATALRYFWRVRGHYREGSERLLHILAQPEAAPTGHPTDAVRAHALNAAGYLQWVQGKTLAAQNLLQEALTLGRAVPDAAAIAFALRYLGLAADARQERTTARQWLEESLAIYRTLDSPNETALALMYLGDAAFSQQAYDEAQRLYQESADLLRQLGNNVVLPYALRHLGYLALARNELNAALRLCTESLHLNLAAGEQQGSAAAVSALAAVAAAGAHWEPAARLVACVTAWLVDSGAQLLPLDRSYYEQTQRLLQQQPQKGNASLSPAVEHLSLEQALAYVLQALTFADEAESAGDRVTSDRGTESPTHPVTWSSGHLVNPASPHNLPAALTPFIGRTRSLAEIVSRLQSAQLLTLVGPGGMGKTRLASEIGRQQLTLYADGVWFVPLASLNTPAALAGTIATALGIAFQGGDPQSALLQSLRLKHLLLILDNFEHLLPSAAGGALGALELVVALLETAPRVQILVTSRQRLNLRSEQIYPVPPLSFATNATLAEATAMAAVRLFVQAVQRVQANFQLTETNLAAVLRICQLVQGMPLGLELAAAHANELPLPALAEAVAQSAEFLTVDWKDLPERQRSMRAVFAWSWRLLTAEEQRVLRQISIFQGGFDHTAAQAVADTSPPLLTHLLHKSLLQRQESAAGTARYMMHELLRQFAAEALTHEGPEKSRTTYRRHAQYYLHWISQRTANVPANLRALVNAELHHDLENCRQAWLRAVQERWDDLITVGLSGFVYLWRQTGRLVEGERMLADALQAFAATTQDLPLSPATAAALLVEQATFLYALDNYPQAIVVAHAAVQKAEGGADAVALVRALLLLARCAKASFDLSIDYTTTLQRALALARQHQLGRWEAEALLFLAQGLGELSQQLALITAALQIAQKLGDLRLQILALSIYSGAFENHGQCARALPYRQQLIALAEAHGEPPTLCNVLQNYAATYAFLGCYPVALSLRLQAQATAHAYKLDWLAIGIEEDIANTYWAMGEVDQAYQVITAARRQVAADPTRLQGMDYSYARILASRGNLAEAQAIAERLLRRRQQAGAAPLHLLGCLRLLAQLHYQSGALAAALTCAEEMMQILADQKQLDMSAVNWELFAIYLTCYEVLQQANDQRANALLKSGYDQLQSQAAHIDAPDLRHAFLENVAAHRTLVAAYLALPAQTDTRQDDTRHAPQDARAKTDTEAKTTAAPVSQVDRTGLYDWAEMPAVDFWVERTAEIAQVTAWLIDPPVGGVPARLVSILGIGGMGKTTLAAAVTKAVAASFSVVIWRSLLNAPPPSELLRNWLQTLSRQTLPSLPDSLDDQLRLLLSYLQQERCLLVLDNVESIFAAAPQSRAGVVRAGYEGYEQLFQRLANSDHQSCLLLTSREQPYALLRSGRQAQMTGRVQVLALAGLDEQAGAALLQSNGLHASAGEAAQLVETYSGNPLALQIVAATITDFFGGDVAAFQQEEGQLFDGMRLVLDQQFARLSPLEREILVWLAIEREPVTVPTLRSNFVQPIASASLLEALQALQNRSLLEKRETGFTLQNVIIEYTTEYLVEQVCREIGENKLTSWQDDQVISSSAAILSPLHPVTPSPPHPVTLSFLNRFALLKAQAKAYVRQSQARLLLQPVAEQLVSRWGHSGLLTRCQEVLALLRTHAPRTPGYAAGNLLNLLLALGIDLAAYDFSNLCVWQPYLREKMLPQFNFTNVDLRGAAFTDTFDIVRALAYSPDGHLLAAGTSDGEIRLWRATDGQLLANVKGHGDIVSWLSFLTDGKTLLSYSHDLALAMWQVGPAVTDTASEAEGVITLRLLYRNDELNNLTNLVAFHPQAELLAFGTERGWLCLWHLGTRRQLSELTLNIGQLHTICFSPDGKTLAMGASDRRIYLWDVDARTERFALRQTLAETPATARDLSFRADGRILASGHEDGSIYLWALDAAGDCATGSALQVLKGHRAGVWRLVFSLDGQLLASGSDDQSVRLWAMGELPAAIPAQPIARFDDHQGWVRSLAFSPDGRSLASAGADRTIRVWDLRRAQLLYTLYGYVKAVKSIAFFPHSHLLVSGSDDQRVRLWDVASSGRALQMWTGHTSFIWQVAVSPDGHLVASAGDDGQIYVRDAGSGQVRKILSGHDSGVTAVAFSPDSKLLASGGIDSRVMVWDVRAPWRVPSGRDAPIHTWAAATQVVWAVAFSPNGEYLAFGGEPNRVRLWHLPSQQFHPALENETGVLRTLAFSPDGTWLAAAGHDAILYLWQVGRATPPILLRGHQHRIRAVAFSPDGRRLATASFDQTVRLWDLQNQTQLRVLQGHSNQVLAVAFSADGALLASASEDETIRLWQGETGEPVAVLPIPGPYSGMKIAGVTGISAAQQAALVALGAVAGVGETSSQADRMIR